MVREPEPNRWSAVGPVNRATAERIGRMYVRQQLSIRRIAGELEMPRAAVTAVIRAAGVQIPDRGSGRPRLQQRAPRPPRLRETLLDLYVDQRRTRAEVAAKLGVSEALVRTWLAELGLPAHSRGGLFREDRVRLAMRPLTDLYLKAELPADRVGKRLGKSRQIVLASAHELGVPVRQGGPPNSERAVVWLRALYRDRAVVDALRRHGIPLVNRAGRLADRFPTPAPLTPQLLHDLYIGCGLSATQIELVTGQPSSTVLRHLCEAGIEKREAGGQSPFTRKVRRELKSDASAGRRGHGRSVR